MIRVLIVDDQAVVRQRLKDRLADAADMVVVGELSSGHGAAGQARGCDVVLLDISMEGVDGVTVLKTLIRAYPALSVLMLTLYTDKHCVDRCLAEGAAGYVDKENAWDELLDAVRAVARGEQYVSPALL